MIRRLGLPLIGILLVFVLVWQVRSAGLAKAAGKAEAARVDSREPARIKAEGRVVTYPDFEATVGTDVAGTILRLPVQERDTVRKGAVIAELRADDLRAAIAQAQARANEAAADIRLYELEVERAQKLWAAQVGTRQALDRAERDRDAAVARRQTALADVARLEALLAKTRIVAPISGVVVTRHVNPGEAVKEGAALVTIADLRRLRVEAEVDEFDAARLRQGAEAIVSAEGYEHEWRARVEEVPDSVVGRKLKPEDPGRPVDTRVLLVKLAFDGSTPLRLGQRVEVEIAAAARD